MQKQILFITIAIVALTSSCGKLNNFNTDDIPEAQLYSLSSQTGAISINKMTGVQTKMFSMGLESSEYDFDGAVVVGKTAYATQYKRYGGCDLITFNFETKVAQTLTELSGSERVWKLGIVNEKLHALVFTKDVIPHVSLVEISETTGGITHKADFGALSSKYPSSKNIYFGRWIYCNKSNTIITVGSDWYNSGGSDICRTYIVTIDMSTKEMVAGPEYTSYNSPAWHFFTRRGDIYVCVTKFSDNSQTSSNLFMVDVRNRALSVKVDYFGSAGGVVWYDKKDDLLFLSDRPKNVIETYDFRGKETKRISSRGTLDALVMIQ